MQSGDIRRPEPEAVHVREGQMQNRGTGMVIMRSARRNVAVETGLRRRLALERRLSNGPRMVTLVPSGTVRAKPGVCMSRGGLLSHRGLPECAAMGVPRVNLGSPGHQARQGRSVRKPDHEGTVRRTERRQ